ncbi:hypothetical protein EVAR_35519_1 [Eumeta japonica]|uniref:Uncharacterized protein n=1 Tax=Eumeta variegata TaxID=151549 RepID=A0A4C1X6S4_EUMVA|nr:hypothetical protein EVAR_35519_1 [Eumeta japonica]
MALCRGSSPWRWHIESWELSTAATDSLTHSLSPRTKAAYTRISGTINTSALYYEHRYSAGDNLDLVCRTSWTREDKGYFDTHWNIIVRSFGRSLRAFRDLLRKWFARGASYEAEAEIIGFGGNFFHKGTSVVVTGLPDALSLTLRWRARRVHDLFAGVGKALARRRATFFALISLRTPTGSFL